MKLLIEMKLRKRLRDITIYNNQMKLVQVMIVRALVRISKLQVLHLVIILHFNLVRARPGKMSRSAKVLLVRVQYQSYQQIHIKVKVVSNYKNLRY